MLGSLTWLPMSPIRGPRFLSHCLCVYGFVPVEVTLTQCRAAMTHGSPGWGLHREGQLNVLGMEGKALFIPGELDSQAWGQGFCAHLGGVWGAGRTSAHGRGLPRWDESRGHPAWSPRLPQPALRVCLSSPSSKEARNAGKRTPGSGHAGPSPCVHPLACCHICHPPWDSVPSSVKWGYYFISTLSLRL